MQVTTALTMMFILLSVACTDPHADYLADQQKEETSYDGDDTFVVVEQLPEYIGGLSSLQEKLVCPEAQTNSTVQGRVIVEFVVDKLGDVRDAKVIKGMETGCEKEIVRLIEESKFEPGRQRGQRVNVKMQLPIVFKSS